VGLCLPYWSNRPSRCWPIRSASRATLPLPAISSALPPPGQTLAKYWIQLWLELGHDLIVGFVSRVTAVVPYSCDRWGVLGPKLESSAMELVRKFRFETLRVFSPFNIPGDLFFCWQDVPDRITPAFTPGWLRTGNGSDRTQKSDRLPNDISSGFWTTKETTIKDKAKTIECIIWFTFNKTTK
jgi:hypothetical protein